VQHRSDSRTARLGDRDTALAHALQHHRAGRLADASELYQRLHAADRDDGEVIFLMGVLCCDLGAFEAACQFLDRAILLTPDFPEARTQWVTAVNGWAEQKISAVQADAAKRLLHRALERMPDNALTLRNLGRVALMQGDAAAAEASLMASLTQGGDHAYALNWLGLAQLQQGKFPDAEMSLRRALRLQPGLDQALNNLGLVLHRQAKLPEAQACFQAVLERDPDSAHARINLAATLRLFGQYAAARDELERVLRMHPTNIDALSTLGVIFQDLGEPESALTRLKQAIALAPNSPSIRWNLSLTQLLLGDFENGWANYEARWAGCDSVRGTYPLPAEHAWQGQQLCGKRLLLWAEQGFGDTLQFIRFAQDLALGGARISVMAPSPLVRLLRTVPGVGDVHPLDGPPPPHDFHCPVMSLPYRLGLTLDGARLHRDTPYLCALPENALRWKERLSGYAGLKVGVVWAGNARRQSAELRAVDLRRSIALERWAPILAVGGCSFLSLQKDARVTGAHATGGALEVHGVRIPDFSAEWADFADTAAFIANLDLIISVDTAVAHLAGAQGVPIWLLNRHDTCWRWLLAREDSPWYGCLRQFRQSAPGDWDPVINAAAAALADAAGTRASR
jgi:tetratricopeptide (TPR) repeat protein